MPEPTTTNSSATPGVAAPPQAPPASPPAAGAQEGTGSDPFAAWASRIEKLEADHHAVKSQLGRAMSQVRTATGERYEEFMEAYASFEEAKAAVLAQGYLDEEAVNALPPRKLRELAKKGVPMSTSETPPRPAGIRAEFEAWAREMGWTPPGQQKPDPSRMAMTPGRAGTPPPGPPGRPAFDPRGRHVKQLQDYYASQQPRGA